MVDNSVQVSPWDVVDNSVQVSLSKCNIAKYTEQMFVVKGMYVKRDGP